MTAAAYSPKPNTVAFRAIAHLETLPRGTEIMTSAWAEKIGVDGTTLLSCMAAPLYRGLVFRRQKIDHPRAPWFWSLSDHSGQPKAPRETVCLPPDIEIPRFGAPAPRGSAATAGDEHDDEGHGRHAHRLAGGGDDEGSLGGERGRADPRAEGHGAAAQHAGFPPDQHAPAGVQGAGDRAADAEIRTGVGSVAADSNSWPAGAFPAGDGSQKPDGGVHGSPARAGSETPPEKGANRDACESPRSTGQSHGAAGSESPAGRGENVAPALGAAPAFECEPRAACSAREAATESAQVAGKELSGCHAEERHAAWTPGRQDAGTSESPGGGPMGVGQAAAAAQADDLRCALWNDGSLEIRGVTVIGYDQAKLSPEKTRELIRYLVATNAGEGV